MSLSKHKPRVCYDLNCTLVEKWLVGSVGKKNCSNKLGFDFSKIMFINGQLKGIFLRVFKANFGRSSHSVEVVGQESHPIGDLASQMTHTQTMTTAEFMQVLTGQAPLSYTYDVKVNTDSDDKTISPLFANQSISRNVYGSFKNKWFFAFLLLVGPWTVSVDEIRLASAVLQQVKGYHKFDASEISFESFLRLIFAKDEYPKLISAGLQVNDFDDFRVNELTNEISDPLPGTIQRLFNVNAKHILMLTQTSAINSIDSLITCDLDGSSGHYMNTESLQLIAANTCNDKSFSTLSNPYSLWKSVVVYAVDRCPNLKGILLEIEFVVSENQREEFLETDMPQLLQWFKDELLAKMGSGFKLKVALQLNSYENHVNAWLAFFRKKNFLVLEEDVDWLCVKSAEDPRLILSWQEM